jgi:membrane-associated phospholipid phosphatase
MNFVLFLAVLQGPPSRSVYHISPPLDITITVGAALGSSLAYLNSDKLITPRCPCDPNEVNAFDRGAIGNKSPTAATLSDVTVLAVLVAPLAIDAVNLGGFHQVWWQDAVVFAQTLAINGALMTTAKFVVQRPLPRTYAGDPSLIDRPEGYRSFYSGHTSTVFAGLSATAMTIRLRYGEKTWPWIVTGVVGTSVAIERVADGRHFPTDVMAGAVMGTAVGIVVPLLHARGGTSGLQASPGAEGGFLVGWQLQF